MKFIIKTNNYFFAVLMLLIVLCSVAYSQRCGDGIIFSIADNSNNLIKSSQLKINGHYFDSYYFDLDAVMKPGMKLKYPEFYQVQKDTIHISKIGSHAEWKDSTHSYIRTFCSILLMRVNIVYDNKSMQLDIYNIPGDIPLKINSIPFTEGKFEINLNGYIDDKNFKKDSDDTYMMDFDKFTAIE